MIINNNHVRGRTDRRANENWMKDFCMKNGLTDHTNSCKKESERRQDVWRKQSDQRPWSQEVLLLTKYIQFLSKVHL